MKYSLEITNLAFRYGDFKVGTLDLRVEPGTVTLISGKIGSGKSSLIRGILKFQTSEISPVTFNGDKDFRQILSYVAPENELNDYLKVNDVVNYLSLVYKSWDKKVFEKLITRFNIKLTDTLQSLSLGSKQRLKICIALAKMPQLIVLDEPTEGIDPAARIEIMNVLFDYVFQTQATMIISTHNHKLISSKIDYVVYMKSGQVHYAGDVENFRESQKDFFRQKGVQSSSDLSEVIDNLNSSITGGAHDKIS